MGSGRFKHVSVQDRASIVKYLEALAEGISNGNIHFRNGEHEANLNPAKLIDLEVKVKSDNQRSNINVKLTWKNTDSDGDSLKIE